MSKLMWTGSDLLFATRLVGGKKFPTKLKKWPYIVAHYVFAKIADLVIDEHYVVSEHLIEELKPLKLKKKISVLIDPPIYVEKFKKIPHKGFNVLYYYRISGNKPFTDWVYGYNVMQSVFNQMGSDVLWFKNIIYAINYPGVINIIEINGDADMKKIFPYIDVMIRPNMHDGAPRLIMECETNDIPYYWSKENPNEEDIINFIKDEIQRKAQSKI